MTRLRHISTLIALGLAVLIAAGCSRVYLAYNTADFFIERYADDWLSLDGAQMASWRPALAEALARHREDELPYLAAFFGALHEGVEEGLDARRVECLLDAFEDIYRRHFRIAAGLAAPLLADLDAEQLRGLKRKFEEDREEAEATPAAVAKRARKRAERYGESTEWWIGPLREDQRVILRDVTAAMPDTRVAWNAYRASKQDGLLALLRRGADEAAIRRYLVHWLVEYRDLPPELRQARVAIRRQIIELFVRMDASFTPAQRQHFTDRLATLRDDFLNLQQRPRRADIGCPAS